MQCKLINRITCKKLEVDIYNWKKVNGVQVHYIYEISGDASCFGEVKTDNIEVNFMIYLEDVSKLKLSHAMYID